MQNYNGEYQPDPPRFLWVFLVVAIIVFMFYAKFLSAHDENHVIIQKEVLYLSDNLNKGDGENL